MVFIYHEKCDMTNFEPDLCVFIVNAVNSIRNLFVNFLRIIILVQTRQNYALWVIPVFEVALQN